MTTNDYDAIILDMTGPSIRNEEAVKRNKGSVKPPTKQKGR